VRAVISAFPFRIAVPNRPNSTLFFMHGQTLIVIGLVQAFPSVWLEHSMERLKYGGTAASSLLLTGTSPSISAC
jgi:hypothetical protein